ncbi:M12 family metallo-peptidase [Alteromonas sp. CYL-A6]|uniref:M12 family metallo-peptidase n=1 Tax=Alteromonas nitratireducens TaxID=3390813 RepID=UPI0034AF9254
MRLTRLLPVAAAVSMALSATANAKVTLSELDNSPLSTALKAASVEKQETISLRGNTYTLLKAKTDQRGHVRMYSDGQGNTFTVRMKDGELNATASIDGVEYDVQGNKLSPTSVSKLQDDVLRAEPRQQRIKLDTSRLESSVREAIRTQHGAQATQNAMQQSPGQSIVISDNINGLRTVTFEAFPDDKFDAVSDLAFNSAQLSQIQSRGVTLEEYTRGDNNHRISIDYRLSPNYLLKLYDNGADNAYDVAVEEVIESVDLAASYYEQSNVNVDFAVNDISVATDSADRFNSTFNATYEDKPFITAFIGTSDDSPFSENFICGNAGLGDYAPMETPSLRGAVTPINTIRGTTNIKDTCMAGVTTAHEFGHIFGLNHDRDIDGQGNPTTRPDFNFNFGFENNDPTVNKYSIMSYGLNCDDCQRVGFFSSPDTYDYVLGVDPYAPTGADASTYLKTAVPVLAADNSVAAKHTQQEGGIYTIPGDGGDETIIGVIHRWEPSSPTAPQTLAIYETFGDTFLATVPLEPGQDEILIQYGSYEIAIVEGVLDGEDVQPVVTYTSRGNDPSTLLGVYDTVSRVSNVNPETLLTAGTSSIVEYEVSQSLLDEIQSYLDYYEDVVMEILPDSIYQTSVVENDLITDIEIISTIDDVISTGRLELRVTTADYGQFSPNFIFRNYYAGSRAYQPIAFKYVSSGSEIVFGYEDAVFNLDENSFYHDVKISTDTPFVEYIVDQGEDDYIDVKFTVEKAGDLVDYSLLQSYVKTAGTVDAAYVLSETDINDDIIEVVVRVDKAAIDQQSGDALTVSLASNIGYQTRGTAVLKRREAPVIRFDDDNVLVAESGTEVSLPIEISNLNADLEYVVEVANADVERDETGAVVYERTSDNRITLDASAIVPASGSLDVEITAYPVDDMDARNNPRNTDTVVVEVNTAPVILGENGASQSEYVINVDETGEYVVDILSISDYNTGQSLTVEWTAGNGAFDFVQNDDNSITVSLPNSVQTDWESVSYTVTADDGLAQKSATVVLQNANYEAPTTPTPEPTPSQPSGESGGGSFGFGIGLLALVAAFRRRMTK